MTLLLALIACKDPQMLTVSVTDAWNEPIEGVTVKFAGLVEEQATDDKGTASMEVQPGALELMIGKEGYIHEFGNVSVPDEGNPEAITFLLFPQPEEAGFYGVGAKGPYQQLGAEQIRTVATEATTWHGIKSVPQDTLRGGQPQRFIFHTTLRASELKQQDLKLSRLEFKEDVEVRGVLGNTEIDLDLWVAGEDLGFDIKGTQSTDDYMIISEEVLEPGIYAFHAQGILNSTEAEALDKLPKELRVAYPFEVK